MKVDWKWFAILIMALVIAALCLRKCSRKDGFERVTTETRTDTLRVRDTILFPAPLTVIYRDTIPTPIDTAAVLAEHFAHKNYSVRYEDTAIKAVTDITITENGVENVALDYELLHKHTLTTKTVFKEQKFALTLGGSLTYSIPNKKPGFELVVGVNIRRSQFHAGYDFISKTLRIGWQYQIIRN